MIAPVPIYTARKHPLDAGRVNFMVAARGYVMVRRPGSMPFIMTEKEWLLLPPFKERLA